MAARNSAAQIVVLKDASLVRVQLQVLGDVVVEDAVVVPRAERPGFASRVVQTSVAAFGTS